MERKASSVKIRTTGDLPNIPEEVVQVYPSMNNWWDDSVAVIDRLRDSATGPAGPAGPRGADGTNATANELKTTLLVEGDVVGTLNEQDIVNKGLDSGTFI